MELLDSAASKELHADGLRPYSHHEVVAAESYEDMASRFLSIDAPVAGGVEVNFLTTASFRRDGNTFVKEFGIAQILAAFCQAKNTSCAVNFSCLSTRK